MLNHEAEATFMMRVVATNFKFILTLKELKFKALWLK